MGSRDIEEGKRLDIQFEKRGGLIPVVVQDVKTKDILMLGYANKDAIQMTFDKKLATFWSTSRNELWTKGETSGDYLAIKDMLIDCDQDAIIYLVEPQGQGSCHTKKTDGSFRKSCFYRSIDLNSLELKKEDEQ